MSVTAEQLKKLPIMEEITNTVNSCLDIIDRRLLSVNRVFGRNKIEYVFPKQSEEGLDLLLQCSVIRNLIKRGFDVKISNGKTNCKVIHISWISELDEKELDLLRNEINKHSTEELSVETQHSTANQQP